MTGDDGAAGRWADQADDQPIDINLLEAQRQRPGLQISETIVVDPSEKKEYTVSGPDEERGRAARERCRRENRCRPSGSFEMSDVTSR